MLKIDITSTELVWTGKYDDDGNLVPPRRVIIPASIILLCLLLLSSGCIKAQIVLDVHENGMSDVAFALGVTSQAKALMSTQGSNPNQLLNTAFSSGESAVSTRQWTEGDYEWTEGKVSSISLEELNKRMNIIKDMVQSFSLVKESGLLKNRFVLDLVLQPFLSNNENSGSDLLFDPSGMFEFRILARMPGKVIETNGVYDQDQAALLWMADNHAPVTIHAVSEVWNWVNIGIFGGGVGLLVIFALIGSVLLTRDQPKRQLLKASENNQRSVGPQVNNHPIMQPALPASKPDKPVEQARSPLTDRPSAPGLLARLQVRNLLEQVNLHILRNSGVIFETPDELRLAWPDPHQPGNQYEIRIRSVGEATITVNEMPCTASLEEIKTALLANLKKLKTM
jgi:hypothetical protein